MINEAITDYWVEKIREYDNNSTIVLKENIFQKAIIKERHILVYNSIVNSLQYYRKIAYLPEYEKNCRKEEYVCAYGESDKSILIALKDMQVYISNENSIIHTDWNKKCLKSIYHESKKEEFYLKVLKVEKHTPDGFTGLEELCFLTDRLNDKQNIVGGEKWIRISLLGIFYEIVDIPKEENKEYTQMTIFDF